LGPIRAFSPFRGLAFVPSKYVGTEGEMSAEPGWFQDPQRPPGHLRWWDGEAWTEQRVAPTDAPVPAVWSPLDWVRQHPLGAVVVAVIGMLVVYGVARSEGEGPDDRDPTRAVNEAGVGGDPDPEPEAGDRAPEGATPRAKPTPRPEPAPQTYLVTRVVDGDTLRLSNGETVRLIGIDTPEAGRCAADRATDTLIQLVHGKQVRLRGSDEGRDVYGRLLRYVDVGRHDAGLRLIKNGLAVARYDSRDGYGHHPRERIYVAADKGARPFSCD
jgi:endonuclease YncB( thermonuclease family)